MALLYFSKRSHTKIEVMDQKAAKVRKTFLFCISKGKSHFAKQTKMSNNGLAPITIIIFSENIHTILLISSISQIPASAVTFSQDKASSLYWEKRWFIATGEKGCVPPAHARHVPKVKSGWRKRQPARGDRVFMWSLCCSRQVWDLVITTALKALLIWKHNDNKNHQH